MYQVDEVEGELVYALIWVGEFKRCRGEMEVVEVDVEEVEVDEVEDEVVDLGG